MSENDGNPRVPTAGAPAPLDFAALRARCLGDAAFANTLVGQFEQTLPETLRALVESVETGNWDQARQLAHRLKGAAATLGATEITRSAIRLEQLSKAQHAAGARTELGRLQAEVDRLMRFVSQQRRAEASTDPKHP